VINIVEWLIEQEAAACELYSNASTLFKKDTELSRFLSDMSEDEAWHYHAMVSALVYLKSASPNVASQIRLNDSTKSEIEAPLIKFRAAIDAGTLSKEALLDGIVEIEFRELNSFFLYAINVLKEKKREFRFVASIIEQHKKRIKDFFETHHINSRYLDRIGHLPVIWENKILVVDDFEPIRELLSASFYNEGSVHTADNGQEGLKKMNEDFYDLVITDIDMPVMNGIEFYQQAKAKFGLQASRFLFYTGIPKSETLEFLDSNKLTYLTKPTPLDKIRTTVREMLLNKPSKTTIV
jgi:two-component system chemotaxis response regulator CheY